MLIALATDCPIPSFNTILLYTRAETNSTFSYSNSRYAKRTNIRIIR